MKDALIPLLVMRFTPSIKKLCEDERSFLESHTQSHTQSSALKQSAISMFLATLLFAAQDFAIFRFVIQSYFTRVHPLHPLKLGQYK